MTVLKFSKMHGLGNDFMVVDAITQRIFVNAKMIQKWACRHRGIGFDQLLLIEPPFSPNVDFHYRIFNADGSEVEQCGNGARCFARFVYSKKLTPKKQIVVSTARGEMKLALSRHEKTVKAWLAPPDFEPKKIGFRAQKREQTYLLRAEHDTFLASVVSMGNPHCVLIVDDVDTVDVAHIGARLSTHERFPQGVNVGFCQIVDASHIRLRVYERGVGETQACGSGACAAAVIAIMQEKTGSKVSVQLRGGHLQIEWQGESEPVKMTGEAEFIFDGQIKV